jgi:hypothetical protein
MFRRRGTGAGPGGPGRALTKMSRMAVTGKVTSLGRALNRGNQVKPGPAHRPGLYPGIAGQPWFYQPVTQYIDLPLDA